MRLLEAGQTRVFNRVQLPLMLWIDLSLVEEDGLGFQRRLVADQTIDVGRLAFLSVEVRVGGLVP